VIDLKLGLCLSGGGIKGAAHIGAIKALEEENIKFDVISGTSSGSIVATLYAVGFTTDEIYEIFKEYAKKIKYIDMKNVLKFIKNIIVERKFVIDGLNSGEKIEKLINKKCNEKEIQNINQIKMPLIIPAVDVVTEQLIVFYSKDINGLSSKDIKYDNNINIGKAVKASCSYPGVFSPVEYNKTYLVDGGIQENIPWKEVKRVGADKVISIVFKTREQKSCCSSIIQVLDKSFQIMCHELARYERYGTDYLLEIEHNNVSLLDWKQVESLYNEGYEQTKKQIELIKRRIWYKGNINHRWDK